MWALCSALLKYEGRLPSSWLCSGVDWSPLPETGAVGRQAVCSCSCRSVRLEEGCRAHGLACAMWGIWYLIVFFAVVYSLFPLENLNRSMHQAEWRIC